MNFGGKILIAVLSVEVLGGLGATVTSGGISGWYTGLVRPPGTPPNWVFGPVWVTLYAMMGVAIALVWHRAQAGGAKRDALLWAGLQLVLNLAWTPVFFGWHQMLVALVVILLLWVALAVTAVKFWKICRLAGMLLVPYWIWVGYATYLNGGFWILNR
jgi:tryptophan-rich sensory protein